MITLPLLEGLDGVEKMSKSKGNYVGIAEPAADMFRKLMNMSDDLTWRYYELLTDLSLDEIAALREARTPQEAKKELARQIVAGFHSPMEAERVAQAWGGLPPLETLDHFAVSDSRLNRTLVQAGFVPSVTEADKLIKASQAVAIFLASSGSPISFNGPAHRLDAGEYILRAGKKYKHITVLAQSRMRGPHRCRRVR